MSTEPLTEGTRYEIRWHNGHVEEIQAYAVVFPGATSSFGQSATPTPGAGLVRFLGGGRVLLAVSESEILSIRPVSS